MADRIARITSISPLLLLISCVVSPLRGPGSTSGGGGTAGVGSIYVSNTSANTILRFANASAASGNVVPTCSSPKLQSAVISTVSTNQTYQAVCYKDCHVSAPAGSVLAILPLSTRSPAGESGPSPAALDLETAKAEAEDRST